MAKSQQSPRLIWKSVGVTPVSANLCALGEPAGRSPPGWIKAKVCVSASRRSTLAWLAACCDEATDRTPHAPMNASAPKRLPDHHDRFAAAGEYSVYGRSAARRVV